MVGQRLDSIAKVSAHWSLCPWVGQRLGHFSANAEDPVQRRNFEWTAHIIAYADREYLTLRINRGDKKYTNISLGTTDLKVAHDKALDVYAATVNQPLRSKSKRYRFATVCDDFLKWKQEQADIGEIKNSAVKTYSQRIHQRIIPYASSVGVFNVGDLKKDSFEDYGSYYRKVDAKGRWKTATAGLSVSTINSDLSTLNEVLGWMVKKNILDEIIFLISKTAE